MASFNRVILVGNLTRDPELRYIPSGTAVSDIGLAVNDRVKRGDQWEEHWQVFLRLLAVSIEHSAIDKQSVVAIKGALEKVERAQ